MKHAVVNPVGSVRSELLNEFECDTSTGATQWCESLSVFTVALVSLSMIPTQEADGGVNEFECDTSTGSRRWRE